VTRRTTGIAFALATALLLAALTWVTFATLSLERRAEENAVHEENVRIALWRMDAALAELLALENARPVDEYRSASVTLSLLGRQDENGASPRPLPQLDTLVRARFEIDPSGRLSASSDVASSAWLAALREQRSAKPDVSTETLEKIPTAADPWPVLSQVPGVIVDRVNVGRNESGQQSNFIQSQLNELSFERRQELGRQSKWVVPPPSQLSSPLQTRWVADELLLVRSLDSWGGEALQGSWLDWPAVRDWLLTEVSDVLPGAQLAPVEADAAPGRRLALLPARLDPGPMAEVILDPWSPARKSLAVTWLASILAFAGLTGLLAGALRLSRRRADFVSAVTHELRTPLTTFRLYSEMLADGMVEGERRQEYLDTLRAEADRLGRLVDNVLAYSQLERRGPAGQIVTTTLEALLEQVAPPLAERAARAGMHLALDEPGEEGALRVRADVSMVGQILLNLVDNACKYGQDLEHSEIRLETERRANRLILRVRDHGPGIEARDRRRLFQPFHRSAEHAAGGQPGVGLGLAVSRRLARAMGGDLRLTDGPSTCFELVLQSSST